ILQSMSEPEPCQFCGDEPAKKECSVASCSRKRLCNSCDDIWHGHPARKDHQRIEIQQSATHTGLNSGLSSDGRQSNFLTKERDSGQPMRERDSGQPMRERDSGQPMREHNSGQPMRERDSGQPMRERDSGEPMRERDSGQPMREHNSGQPMRERDSGQPMRERNSGQPMRERDSGQPMRERDSGQPMREHNSGQPMRERDSGQPMGERNFGQPIISQHVYPVGQLTGISWTCAYCTTVNEFNCNSDTTKKDRLACQVCSKTSSLADIVESIKASTGKVLCVQCTLLNDSHLVKCDGCGEPLDAVRIQGASSAGSQPSEYSSGGAVANDYNRPFFEVETAHYNRSGDSAGNEAAARNTDAQSATSSVPDGCTDGDTLEAVQCPTCTFENRLTATVCEMCHVEIQPASHLSVVRNRSSGEVDSERHQIDDTIDRLRNQGLTYEQACRAVWDQVNDPSARPTEFSSSAKEMAGVVPENSEPAVSFTCCKCHHRVEETDPFEVKICGCKICVDCFWKTIELIEKNEFYLGDFFCYCERASIAKRDQNEHYGDARLQIRQKLREAESASILERFDQKLSIWRRWERFPDPSAAVKDAFKFYCSKCRLAKHPLEKIDPPTCSCSLCQDCFSTDVFRKLVNRCHDKYEIKCPVCFGCFILGTSACSEHAKWLEDCIWGCKSTNWSVPDRRTAANHLRLLVGNPGSSVASGGLRLGDFRSEYLHRDLPQNSSLQLVGDCGHGLRPANNGYLWCIQCVKFACPTCKRVIYTSTFLHKCMY
ncbi:hypothetical protein BOX15_Mlig004413g3, partial [Macrostomum lignano]